MEISASQSKLCVLPDVKFIYIASATKATYVASGYADNDSVTCLVTSHTPCGSIGTANDEEMSLAASNMPGQVVYSGVAVTQYGTLDMSVNLPGTLANGMYILTIKMNDEMRVFHIAVEQ